VEALVVNADAWRGRNVLITGHTGFKGAWLSLWLNQLGARVSGFALPPQTDPSLFDLAGVGRLVPTTLADLADRAAVEQHVQAHAPEVVFHMAAQALVRRSYEEPVDTFLTNVVGAATLLDAVRRQPSVKAVVVVTSDKCYENREWPWPYRETEPMGGHDPYSASKGCEELVVASMRRSYFAPYAPAGHGARIASARAGNVIGGGDWSADRLVPDLVRGCLGPQNAAILRNPGAVRPWQHVLEPLSGYLLLAERLLDGVASADDGWNFGPEAGGERPVQEVAAAIVAALGQGQLRIQRDEQAPHEANLLRLDCSKARLELGWRPRLTFDETIALTAGWYGGWRGGEDVLELTNRQIAQYSERWTV
jgi:CDP-glucose 4,6-dehydratase